MECRTGGGGARLDRGSSARYDSSTGVLLHLTLKITTADLPESFLFATAEGLSERDTLELWMDLGGVSQPQTENA